MSSTSLESQLKPILGNKIYQSITLSVPSDEQLYNDEKISLSNWQPTTEDQENISAFRESAEKDTKKLAELAKRRIDKPTPLTEAAFNDLIKPLSGLTFESFNNSVPKQTLQAVEIFLSGIHNVKKSEQTYYHVRNVAALSTEAAGKIYDALRKLNIFTAEAINAGSGLSVSAEDANQIEEIMKTMSKEQFMSLYCASAFLHDFGKLFTPTALLEYDKLLPEQTFQHIMERVKLANGTLYVKNGHEPITGAAMHINSLIKLVKYCQNLRQDELGVTIMEVPNPADALSHFYIDSECKKPLLYPDEAAALDSDPSHSVRTLAEVETLHEHVRNSGILIDNLDIKDPLHKYILDSAKFHHEKMDGTGYGVGERGVAGINIPLMGRMMKVVDTFESMVSPMRRYKKPRTLEQAINILHNKTPDGSDAAPPINEFDTKLVNLLGRDFLEKFHTVISEQGKATMQSVSLVQSLLEEPVASRSAA